MSAVVQAPVKFLLVDDLEENLLALEALLARPELSLLRARSGQEALELLLIHDVALAIIDVQMPEMDGFELAELMRGTERTRHVPIIFVTAGLREPARVFQGYDAGAVDFLFKPIDPRILRHKTETFFQLYRQKQERDALTKELEETLRFNETFVAIVGHDLRNPLNAVMMAVQVLKTKPLGPEELRLVETIRNGGRRMAGMLDDLSDLARVRLGEGLVVQREPADFGAILRRVVAEHRMAHPERGVELEAAGDLEGRWDEPRVEQLVGNLLGNAIRHGEKAGAVRIVVDGTDAERVRLAIRNPGEVPREVLPHLFDAFRSGAVRRGRSQGLGLGLYIVKQIALAHGGDASIDSSAEVGTEVTVTLPRA